MGLNTFLALILIIAISMGWAIKYAYNKKDWNAAIPYICIAGVALIVLVWFWPRSNAEIRSNAQNEMSRIAGVALNPSDLEESEAYTALYQTGKYTLARKDGELTERIVQDIKVVLQPGDKFAVITGDVFVFKKEKPAKQEKAKKPESKKADEKSKKKKG